MVPIKIKYVKYASKSHVFFKFFHNNDRSAEKKVKKFINAVFPFS